MLSVRSKYITIAVKKSKGVGFNTFATLFSIFCQLLSVLIKNVEKKVILPG